MIIYIRGDGGITLTQEQVAELQTLLTQQLQLFGVDKYAKGLGVPIYEQLFEWITEIGIIGYTTSMTQIPTPIYGNVPKPGVDPSVWRWIEGAIKVNSGEGFFADFIREYTKIQFELRGGNPDLAEDYNQQASNEIAFSLAEDIIKYQGLLPGAMGLGAIDAGAAASTVFGRLEGGNNDYAPWAGSLLFPYLGVDNFFIDLLLNSEKVIAKLGDDPAKIIKYNEGTYDLIAMLQAAQKAGYISGMDNKFDAAINLLFPGVTDKNQDNIIAKTDEFFNKYYEFEEPVFSPGDDLVFKRLNSVLNNYFPDVKYQVCSYQDDTLTIEDSETAVIMNGGRGNDNLTGGAKDDLLDGDQDNDTLSGADGNDYLYGGAGNDTIYGDEGDDQLHGGKEDDKLFGNEGNDFLGGDEGNDQLSGGEGADYLEGGIGNDTYIFSGKFERDIVEDEDNIGKIIINGNNVNNVKQVRGTDIIYRDDEQNPTVEILKINEGDSVSLLITPTNSTSGSVLVKNWEAGGLGITLGDAETEEPDESALWKLTGDGGNNALNAQNYLDDHEGLTLESYNGLKVDGGGGRDIIMGMLHGNDILLGGDDADVISGGFTKRFRPELWMVNAAMMPVLESGTGVDYIDGGKGNDYITVSGMGSVAKGGEDNDLLMSGYGLYADIFDVDAVEGGGDLNINPHGDISRDKVWGDLLPLLDFSVNYTNGELTFGRGHLNGLERGLREGVGIASGENYVTGITTVNGLDMYSFTYNYSNKDELKTHGYVINHFNILLVEFGPTGGHTYDEFAAMKGSNLYGDAGDDNLLGGMFADYLSGGADKDFIKGGEGHDILDGGTEDDILNGEAGNDIIIGGHGGDTLYGSHGNLRQGAPDDDALYGGEGNDTLHGGAGDDYLEGGSGQDKFFGGAGKDTIIATLDDLQINGGAGDDLIILEKTVVPENQVPSFMAQAMSQSVTQPATQSVIGATPSATTVSASNIATAQMNVMAASSNTTVLIADSEGSNTLALAGVSGLSGMGVTATGSDLILNNNGEKIYITNGLNGAISHFATGGESAEDFTSNSSSVNTVTLNSLLLSNLSTAVTRTAQTANTELVGGLMNDILTAHAGGSSLMGGKGIDTLKGGLGNDTYTFSLGDGKDTITEAGGNNTIKLREGITPEQITLRRSSGNFILSLNTADAITVSGMHNATGAVVANRSVQQIEFANGDVWDIEKIKQQMVIGSSAADTIYGFDTADTIRGNAGNDQLHGVAGDDIYTFARGDGTDTVTDTAGNDVIRLDAGISQSDIVVRRSSGSLIVSLNTGEKITVNSMFNSTTGEVAPGAVERIEFAGGNTWDLQQLQREAVKGSGSDDIIYGFETNDTIQGGAGIDMLVALAGDDVLDGGSGNDDLQGGTGNDTYHYSLGSGADRITEVGGVDQILLGNGITESDVSLVYQNTDLVLKINGQTAITVVKAFSTTADAKMDSIVFGNGSVWNYQRILQEVVKGTAGDDIIVGTNANDTITGNKGNDVITDQGGDDTYIYNVGDGKDTINDTSGINRIRFGAGIDSSSLLLRRSGADLKIIIGDEEITVRNAINTTTGDFDSQGRVARLEFTNGSSWDLNRIKQELLKGTTDNDQIVGLNSNDRIIAGQGNDYVSGGDGNDILLGGSGDDDLRGEAGNDVLIGGTGKDGFQGGLGDDIYEFNIGDANVWGGESLGDSGGNDSIFLHTTESQVADVSRVQGNLVIQLVSGDKITVSGMFQASTGNVNVVQAIESIKFSDGNTWDLNRIKLEALKGTASNDVIESYSDNNIIRAGKGYDVITDAAGNDTYHFARGDGVDRLTDKGGIDTIILAAGILPSDVKIHRNTDGDVFVFVGEQEGIHIEGGILNGAPNPANAIENIQFVNGDIWNASVIEQKINDTVGKEHWIIGANTWDEIDPHDAQDYYLHGMDGNDDIHGGSGNDTLLGGQGINILNGFSGDDTYLITREEGEQIIPYFRVPTLGKDRILFADDIAPEDVQVSIQKTINIQDIQSGVLYENSLVRSGQMTKWDLVLVVGQQRVYLTGQFESEFGISDGAILDNNSLGLGGVEFGDGTYWDIDTLLNRAMQGSVGEDWLLGAVGSDQMNGFDGNDILSGMSGNDVISGGAGVDQLSGGFGDDTYLYNKGDGIDKIVDVEGNSSIILGNQLSKDELVIYRDDANVVLQFNERDKISIKWFEENAPLPSLVFSDDTIWSKADIVQRITSRPYDIIPPSQPVVAINTAGTMLSGSGEYGAVLHVATKENVEITTLKIDNPDGSFSVKLPIAFEAGELLHVTVRDSTGNVSPVKVVTAPDRADPFAPTANFNTAGSIVNGIAEEGSTVVVKNNTGTQLGSAIADSVTGVYSVTLNTPQINNEIINVTATDKAGNVSSIAAIIAPDKTAPLVPSAAFNASGNIISGVAEKGSTVSVKNALGVELKSVVANATTGVYSITLPVALINTEIVTVTATDLVGNVSPTATIVAPDKTHPNSPTAMFDATGKVVSGTAEAGSIVTVKNTSGAQLGIATADVNTGTYTVTLTTALINKQTVNVTAKDAAGNISAIQVAIAPDKTQPTAPTATFDAAGKVISGIAEAGSIVAVKTTTGIQLGSVTANATSGAYSVTLDVALINKENVNVTATDAASNVSPIRTVIAPDKTPPSAPTAQFDAAGKIITGIAEAGSTVIVKNTTGTQLRTAVANATSGAYSITLTTALTNGQLVNVTAKDLAGNESSVRQITAPLMSASSKQTVRAMSSESVFAQTDSLIQAMASFAPPSAIETRPLVAYYDANPSVIAVNH